MDNYVITIAREFGSGGRTIGKILSDKLGIAFYDKELIRMASDESGINESLFGLNDEKTQSSIFKKVKVYDGEIISPNSSDFTSEKNLFSYQAKIIKKLADENAPCIIVGRCADFILSDRKNVIKLFIWADHDACVSNAMDVCGYDCKDAEKQVEKLNRERAAYYKAHTGREWTDVRNYDLCLNTSEFGFEKCLDIITHFIKVRG